MIRDALRDAVRDLSKPSTRLEFSPFEYDPYLLFDAESSMMGELESPTLDLDPYHPETLDVITATRSGTATYMDSMKVVQTADPDTVRVDWSLGYPAMLIEPSATNLLPYSEDFSVWTELNTTITVNDSLAPDGNQTAAKVTADSGSAVKRISSYAATASAIDYTVSFYAKAGSHQFVQTTVSNSGALYANFDLISGQSQAFGGATSKMTLAANGFYRCEFTFTGAASFAAGYISFADSLTHARGDSSSSAGDFYIWGAQVETGSVATSYIPTDGGSVAERTRNADNLVIDGTDFSDFYNATEGTFYVEADIRQLGTKFYFDVSNGASSERLLLYDLNTDLDVFTRSGGITVDKTIGSTSTEGLQRIAFSYSSSNIIGSLNGNAEVTEPSPAISSSTTQMAIGSRYNYGAHLNGHIKRLIYWPTHSDSL